MRVDGLAMLSQRPKWKAIAIVLVLATGIAAFVAVNSWRSAAITNVPMTASWATAYTSFAALKANADVAVDGTITRIAGVTDQTPRNPASTDYVLRLQTVGYDPKHLIQSSEIVIHQTGGVIGGHRYEVTDDPLFQVGEHVILYLKQYGPDHYYVIGGPTGRFKVEGGSLRPMAQDGVRLVSPMSEAGWLATLR